MLLSSTLINSKRILNYVTRYRFSIDKDASNVGIYDYVIIGGGSAGCLLANRLSKNPNTLVLLIEAGGKDSYPWIHIPVGYLYCIDNPRTDWQFKTSPDPGLNNRSLLYPRGKVLGGSSSINGMIYMRGQKNDYETWSRLTGDDAWNWESCLNRFKTFEDYYGGKNAWHGVDGEWRVEKQRLSWPILETFKLASSEFGIPITTDFNRGNNFGVGYFDVNQQNGWRLNTSQAFLKPASQRSNLTIITHAVVDRLIFDTNTKQCKSVIFYTNDQKRLAEVNNEAILCAGSIGTVQILERSGIGQSDLLTKLGIPIIQALSGVGKNLQDHLQLRMIYRINKLRTLNTVANSLFGKAMIGLEYLLYRTGPMAMAPSQLGMFAYSDNRQSMSSHKDNVDTGKEDSWPNIQYHIQPLSLDRFGESLHTFDAFTASVCNLHPSSRGSVHITSKEYNSLPNIQVNYLSTAADRKVAVDSIQLTRKIIMQSKVFEPFSPTEFKPGLTYQSEKNLEYAAGDIGTTIFHPVGTCRMGSESDKDAVLDSQLRVRGVKGVRVADASVMPTITSGNTAAPTMMIAQRLAEILTSD